MIPEDPNDTDGVDELLDVLNRQLGRLQIPPKAPNHAANFDGDRSPMVGIGTTGKPFGYAERETSYQLVSVTNGDPSNYIDEQEHIAMGSTRDTLKVEWGDGQVSNVDLYPTHTAYVRHWWEGHPTEPRVYAGQVTNLQSGKVMPFFVVHPPENGVQPSWSSNGFDAYGPDDH